MLRRQPKAPRRAPHPDPIVESRLRTIDLLQQRLASGQAACAVYHKSIEGLLREIQQRTRGDTENCIVGIEAAKVQLGILNAEIDQLIQEILTLHGDAEIVQQQWLERQQAQPPRPIPLAATVERP